MYKRTYPPALPRYENTLWLLFQDGKLLVRDEAGEISLPRNLPVSHISADPIHLAESADSSCLTDELGEQLPVPEGFQLLSLRDLYGLLSDADYELAGYASEIVYWRRTSKFCPVCGHATLQKSKDWGRECPQCGHVGYPRVSPAVLILVHDGDRILLSNKPGWGTRFSILAGFVEPGESLEDCVRREVEEEVGVELGELTYFGSQPWPYPHQLMVGFMATYVSGEISVDEDELDDAAWFTPSTMPDLPAAVSLSRKMIDAWLLARD